MPSQQGAGSLQRNDYFSVASLPRVHGLQLARAEEKERVNARGAIKQIKIGEKRAQQPSRLFVPDFDLRLGGSRVVGFVSPTSPTPTLLFSKNYWDRRNNAFCDYAAFRNATAAAAEREKEQAREFLLMFA